MEIYKFGPNDVYVDGDLIVSIAHGEADLEATRQFLDLAAQIEAKYGHVLMLTDATEGFALSPESRRYAAEWAKHHSIQASAICGASPATAAFVMLVVHAMSLFSPSYQTNMRFFATAAKAHEWLNQFRALEFRREEA